MHSMNYIGRFFSNFKDFYNEINTATLTGAIDVIVVEQPDGTYNCSPFHVRFGKLGVLRSREKVVDIEINGEPQGIHMKLGESGEAFFVEELDDDDESGIPDHLATSPIPTSAVSELETIFQSASMGSRRRSFVVAHDDGQDNDSPDITDTQQQSSGLQSSEDDNKDLAAAAPDDYRKRSNTVDGGDPSSEKQRKMDFMERQLGLGNLAVKDDTHFTPLDPSPNAKNVRAMEESLGQSIDERVPLCPHNVAENDNVNAKTMEQNLIAESATNLLTGSTDVVAQSCSSVLIAADCGAVSNGHSDNRSNCSKKKRRKTKRKTAIRKLSSHGHISNAGCGVVEATDSPTVTSLSNQSGMERNDSTTDVASLDSSNSSDPEIQHLSKNEELVESGSTSGNNNMPRKMIDPDLHFFSDTEVTITATTDMRSDPTVTIDSVQSDSEIEVMNRKESIPTEGGQSWEWGGFPSPTPTNSPDNNHPNDSSSAKSNERSMLTNMLSFMKRSHQKQTTQNEGIYLSDLNSVDPEVAALYFATATSNYANQKIGETDCESGNGPSLAQSPNSADGCKSIDSEYDELTKEAKLYSNEIQMSLCGWNCELNVQLFEEHAISFSDFCNNPLLIEDPNLVVNIRGKYYNWKVAAPIIASLMVFNRPLLQGAVDQLTQLHMPGGVVASSNTVAYIKGTDQGQCSNVMDLCESADRKSSGNEQKTESTSRSSWWNWRRQKSSRENTPPADLNTNQSVDNDKTGTELDSSRLVDPIDAAIAVAEMKTEVVQADDDIVALKMEHNYASEAGVNNEQQNNQSLDANVTASTSGELSITSTEKYRKTLRLSSKQIDSLNLRDGLNEIDFSVTTAYQGTSRCQCHLYKWRWDDKIVISDIDGTITKSDVLGHILPIVGKDWAQSGVAQLFNKIRGNGYKLLYLSARAIGQARITREYLKSIKQGDLTMPDGPILLNPTSLITAFHREVIEKKPEQFKISCMSDIKALFPADAEPFYAGYGNRINDVWAYRAVGIPIVRIFTINPKGELKHELTQTFQSSYVRMTSFVDQLFPPLMDDANEFSQFTYWRDPIPTITTDDQLFKPSSQ